jgi:2'-5' RNA ligase superfamily
VDHVVVPLSRDHAAALDPLVAGAAAAAGIGRPSALPHVTLLAYTGVPRRRAGAELGAVVAATPPFVLHAHGYGFFSGQEPGDLSLHVPVVRSPEVEAVQHAVWVGLRDAGADVARWTDPDLWSPHITILERDLDADRLASATAWLARRHHPHWSIPVDRLLLLPGRRDADRDPASFPLSGRPACLR